MAHANTEQILSAYSTLTDLQILIMRKMAAKLSPGTFFTEPMDLVHETLGRFLDGRRNWEPGKWSFWVAFCGAMRSIAGDERKKARQAVANHIAVDEVDESEMPRSASAEDEALEAGQLELTAKMADSLRRKLAGDEGAQKVLNGLVSGLSAKEMRESFHMDERAFDAAVHRIVRRARQSRMH